MKKLLSFMICLLFIAAAAAVQTAAIGEDLKAVSGTPAIDGIVDRVWNSTARQKLRYSVAGDLNDGKSPGSCSAYVSSLWDDNALYFLIEVNDNDYIIGEEGEYGSDEIRIYIDENDWFGYTWRYGQVCLIIEPDENGRVEVIGDISESTQIAYSKSSDSKRYLEIKYVPTKFKIEKDATLLVDFRFNDVYTNSNGENSLAFGLTWSDELNEGDMDSSNWSYMRLAASGGGGASGEGFESAESAASSIGQPLITNYKFLEGSYGYGDEHANNLFDDNVFTKFCTSERPATAMARLNGEYIITGLILATANDTEAYPGRNPDEWKLEGSDNQTKWTVLAEGNDDCLKGVNFTYFAIPIKSDGKGYKFIRFTNKRCETDIMQLSELLVCGIKANSKQEDIDALLNPTVVEEKPIENAIYLPITLQTGGKGSVEVIAAPTAPGDHDNGSDMAVTVIVISAAAALVITCAVIAFVQSKQKRQNII